MNSYLSAVCLFGKPADASTILNEIYAGNYFSCLHKPTFISVLGAVPKSTSPNLYLIHHCSMPLGQTVSSYIDIDKQKFRTLDYAMQLIEQSCYLVKVDLCHLYRSVPVYPVHLSWPFWGDKCFTYLMNTWLSFGGQNAPVIFHRITQSVRHMMSHPDFTVIVYPDDFLVVGTTFK